MTAEAAIFTCSICGEPAGEICAYCTKDACANHRCHRCKRCSDCCECEIPLSAAEAPASAESQPTGEVKLPEEPQIESLPESRMEAPAPAAESANDLASEPGEDFLPPHTENPIL